ncbi:MAG: hypothetical protein M0Z46_08835 [Actinomycetota bacterium]|nr:hypothetical protein [Actinomycetota bacterium]
MRSPSPRAANWRRRGGTLLGLVLIAASVALIAYPLAWQHRQNTVARTLVAQRAPRQVVTRHGRGAAGVTTARCVARDAVGGVLGGLPGGVVAPVEQGTSGATLSVAVGHDQATPWPGGAGVSILLAHDVGFFARNAQLRPGDLLTYTSGCTRFTFRVVSSVVSKPGQPAPLVSPHELVLDSCWPVNALWFTPDRYLVLATLTSTSAVSPTPAPALSAPPTPPGAAAILSSWQMGTLTLRGAPPSVAESAQPLAVQLDALNWLDAHRAQLDALRRAAGSAPLSVTETWRGSRLAAVELDAGSGAVRVPLHA